jgi:hypothetical protein
LVQKVHVYPWPNVPHEADDGLGTCGSWASSDNFVEMCFGDAVRQVLNLSRPEFVEFGFEPT